MKKLFATLLILFVCPLLASEAKNVSESTKAEYLENQLPMAKTPEDSIKIYYNIFDVLPRQDRIETGRKIYSLADKTGNNNVKLDIMRLISLSYEDDDVLGNIEEEIRKLPDSDKKKEVLLFIRMRRVSLKSRRLPEEAKQKEIVKILKESKNPEENDSFQDILDLYTLTSYMRNDATGNMLKEYVDRLIEKVNSKKIDLFAVKNLIYSEASNIYSDAEDYRKAIEINRRLLSIIDSAENQSKKNGRNFRNFDVSRYISYRRMLRNAKGLKPGEASKFYEKALNLAATNSDVKYDMDTNPRIKAYYYMAIGDYNSAKEVLKEVVAKNNTLPTHKQFLEMLIEASEKTGDDKTRLQALTSYVTMLTELNELKAAENNRELKIKYDLQDLEDRNKTLETENEQQEVKSEKSIMGFLAFSFIIILIVLTILMFNWSRYRKNTMRLGEVVDNMHRERHRLRNSLYSDYDEATENDDNEDTAGNELSWAKRMKTAGINKGNCTVFMAESIINDLMYIASTGHSNLKKLIAPSSADSILRRAESRALAHNGEEAKILVEYPENDFEIVTDADCLAALLTHIFKVSAKYSPESTVELKCINRNTHVDFIITCLGSDAASQTGPQIFHDIAISNLMLNYKNSGLFICRMISLLLRCDIIPDKNYTDGARYIVRIPMKIEN